MSSVLPHKTLPKDATPHTRSVLSRVTFNFNGSDINGSDINGSDFDRARRGFIAAHPTGRILGPDGGIVWDVARHDFVRAQNDSPDTVNPSLWRHAQLDAIHGLFEVAPGVWQARGYDLSNITFVAGGSGWIVIDPLTSEATARACLELADTQLGRRPVVAVIYTHSHIDHFGGVLGVTSQADVDAGRCIVVAPEGFLHEAVAENVIGGPAMLRRSAYQFGPLLPPGPKGHVDSGLGTAVPAGQSGLIAPTHDVTHTGQEMVIDGVRIVFQNTPGTEAPAEMNFFFPDFGWLCMAENCSHTMHNLVPIRGAQVRDALAWSKYIGESIRLFADATEVMFTSHHWPRWGRDDVRHFLTLQRDLYRYIHDQTMRHANHGLTAPEIAEILTLPPEFTAESHTRGYYGHLVHNVKAVYQRYLSWYDGNPAHLHPHPPVEAGKRYVEFMGGPEALLAKARASFDAGDYRWVTEVVNHLVFADPTNQDARHLQADALEQLGYQTESSTYRNAYLTGAQELRMGPPKARPIVRRGVMQGLTVGLIFDSLAVRLKAEEVGGARAVINFRFTDIGEDWVLSLENSTLHSVENHADPAADATLTMTRVALLSILSGDFSFADALSSGTVAIDGDAGALLTVFGHLDTFETGFPIVEP